MMARFRKSLETPKPAVILLTAKKNWKNKLFGIHHEAKAHGVVGQPAGTTFAHADTATTVDVGKPRAAADFIRLPAGFRAVAGGDDRSRPVPHIARHVVATVAADTVGITAHRARVAAARVQLCEDVRVDEAGPGLVIYPAAH